MAMLSALRSQVPHRRKRQPAARTARAIALGGVFGQALKRPPRPLVSCVAARSLVSGGGAGRVCRATLQQQPRCARNQHACCLPSHRAVARRPPPPAFRRAPPDAEACSFSIAAKQERHLANDAPLTHRSIYGSAGPWKKHHAGHDSINGSPTYFLRIGARGRPGVAAGITRRTGGKESPTRSRPVGAHLTAPK